MENCNLSPKEIEILNEIESMKQLNVKSKIDPSKLEYNNRYKSFDFWAKKFPFFLRLDEINERTEFDPDYVKVSER